MIEVTMNQWGVGHGGFHTAEIRQFGSGKNETTRYIYDCGSKAPVALLSPSIKLYAKQLKASGALHINTLYLSHFDYDHVNGLEKLSKEIGPSIQVRRVVVPFLTPEQQLATIVSQAGVYPPLYMDLVLSPRETLGGLFPGTAVEILPPGQPDEITEEGGGLSPDAPGGIAITEDLAAPGGMEVVWEVIAYAQPDVPAVAKQFWKQVQEELGLSAEVSLNEAMIRSLLENHQKALRKLANELLGSDGSNASSIILYSAPASDCEATCFVKINDHKIPWTELPKGARAWWPSKSGEFGGWLSTGDARLETKSGVDGLVGGLGVRRSHRVTVIAAPHHGSKNNSGVYLWQRFPNATCVTAHATGKGGHHPSDQVVSEIKNIGRKLFVIKELSSNLSMSCRV